MKKIIGIFVCTLLIATAITAVGQINISIKKDEKINPMPNPTTWIKT